MPPLIRLAEHTDAETIIDFNARMALETEGKTLDLATLAFGVKAALLDPARGRYFLAELDSTPAGQLMLTPEWSDWRNAWFWWIQSVYVRPECRRQGVFRALFAHVDNLARQDPEVIGLRLYVEKNNRGAQETYERLGLKEAGYLLLQKWPL